MMFLVTFLAVVIIAALGASQDIDSVPRLDGRILGNQPVHIVEYNYQASISYFGYHICGGAIISSIYVITAAHCTDGIPGSLLSIRAGSSIADFGGSLIPVIAISQHPDYNNQTLDYDISVLTVGQEFTFNDFIGPIALPLPNQETPAGSNAVVSGWRTLDVDELGTPNQLEAVEVVVVDLQDCSTAYSTLTESMICAVAPTKDVDTCQGDSGGPLVVNGELVGSSSWGYGCNMPDYPVVYSSISTSLDYITNVTGL